MATEEFKLEVALWGEQRASDANLSKLHAAHAKAVEQMDEDKRREFETRRRRLEVKRYQRANAKREKLAAVARGSFNRICSWFFAIVTFIAGQDR